MPVKESAGGAVSTQAPTLEFHEIQALVLRPRPAPYFGAHVLLQVDDAVAGRALLRRLRPYVDSAENWSSAANAWLAVAISYTGFEALGLPSTTTITKRLAATSSAAARSCT